MHFSQRLVSFVSGHVFRDARLRVPSMRRLGGKPEGALLGPEPLRPDRGPRDATTASPVEEGAVAKRVVIFEDSSPRKRLDGLIPLRRATTSNTTDSLQLFVCAQFASSNWGERPL